MPETITKWSQVVASSSFDSSEKALETLVLLKDLELSPFSNRDTDLNANDDSKISIAFSDDESQNSLNLTVDDQNDIEITAYITEEDTEVIPDIFEALLNHISPLSVNQIFVGEEFSREFRSLGLPIKQQEEFEVQGITLSRDQEIYYIQQGKEEGLTRATLKINSVDEFTENIPEDFVKRDFAQLEKLIMEEL